MAMVVNHNIPALQTYNVVNSTSSALQKSINKLSTGLRINSAADDAAGLAISEKMRAQVRGLDQAVGNSQDGISMIQTAEGALSETHSILQRMRELSVQAANDTLTQQDRGYIQEEVDQLREEITRIGNTTQFNKKKLLNGDAAALWSSDNLETKAVINGGLRTIDQFGQKNSVEGNYKITIKADPGKGEIQKTDIFRVKHNTIGIETKAEAISDVSVDNVKANKTDGTNAVYTVTGGDAAAVTAKVMDATGTGTAADWAAIDGTLTGENNNVEFAIELTDLVAATTGAKGSATFHISGWSTNNAGVAEWFEGDITAQIASGGSTTAITPPADFTGGQFDGKMTGLKLGGIDTANLAKGDKAIMKVGVITVGNPDVKITVAGENDPQDTHEYNLQTADIAGQDVTLKHLYFDDAGDLQTGSVTLSVASKAADGTTALAASDLKTTLAKFEVFEIGDVANENVRLYDLEKFWDSEGNFMLEDPQSITLTQGDGKQAGVTLYANDTIGDVREKLNDAIGNDLGQSKYLDGSDTKSADSFVTYVNEGGEAANTSQSVAGTFQIRTLMPGDAGRISMSGNEAVINAFSLNTIQKATESNYKVSIEDAHSGKSIAKDVQVTGNKLIGIVNENVDVEFDALAGVTAKFNDTSKKFDYTTKKYETTLHLSDNTTVFQIGANEGEDMGINIGDMRSHALGLDAVNVTNRESAARSITIVDNAIDKVSSQRAKLGAYQNRLEHTINNLTTASENLTAAESRIRDTDMAKEMMNFSKLQIMLQAGNSMLAQANQLPQNVLSLVR